METRKISLKILPPLKGACCSFSNSLGIFTMEFIYKSLSVGLCSRRRWEVPLKTRGASHLHPQVVLPKLAFRTTECHAQKGIKASCCWLVFECKHTQVTYKFSKMYFAWKSILFMLSIPLLMRRWVVLTASSPPPVKALICRNLKMSPRDSQCWLFSVSHGRSHCQQVTWINVICVDLKHPSTSCRLVPCSLITADLFCWHALTFYLIQNVRHNQASY